ncbi:M4 family metallopeptidase [Streptomyces uncialis]|uniref:M4 family metallopeptidase n=1 Tax=Streptomyces uncialis TaxID=1048205 RepID=UPI00379D5C2C
MRRSPFRTFRTSASAALIATGAVLAATLPSGAAGAAPAAPSVPAPVARAGALPVKLSPAQHAGLLADATAARAATARAIGLGGKEKLVARNVLKDADGTLHTRYERTYGGLPVLGGDLVVHTDPARTARGTVKGVTRATGTRIALPTTVPARGPATATTYALARAGKDGSRGARAAGAPRAVVWAADGRPVLAWETVVDGVLSDGGPSELHVITDAADGTELHRYDAVKRGSGNTQYSGQVPLDSLQNGSTYSLIATDHGAHKTFDMNHLSERPRAVFTDADNVWGDGVGTTLQTQAADAAHGAQVTWDYYKGVHGRNGLRNDGDGGSSWVNRGGFNGALWQDRCQCVSYGDGHGTTTFYTSVDIAAHEMTHGLTAETARLNLSREAEGLNEATSDIFAAGVEFHTANTTDVGDYLVGERVNAHGNGTPLRYMDRPARDGASPNYWYPGLGAAYGNVTPGHVRAAPTPGPANHWFYLAAEGSGAKTINGVAYDSPTADGLPVTAIGRAAAERIWYRALTVYMTSNTDYAGARTATLAAAADLYGVSSPTYTRVMDAWGAVNVGTRSGNPAPRPPGPAFENLTDVPIPDAPGGGTSGAPAFSSIGVSGVTDPALARIEVDIVHGGMLYVDLVAPDGTVYKLKDIYDGAPVAATYTVDLSPEAPNGTWRLRVQDTTPGGVGHISGWRMTF